MSIESETRESPMQLHRHASYKPVSLHFSNQIAIFPNKISTWDTFHITTPKYHKNMGMCH